MWLFYVLLAGILYTIQGLLTRHVLKGKKDAWAFSFYFSLVGAVVSFPFMLTSPKIPVTITAWIFAILVGSLIVLHNFFNFKASNYLEASLLGAITKFRLIWVFLLGLLMLHETVSLGKILGILLTIIAGLFIANTFKKSYKVKGILFVFISTIIYALVVTSYKFLFTYFSVPSATFFAVFLIPTIINMLVMPKFRERVVRIIHLDGKFVLLATSVGGLSNLAINQSFALGEVSRVAVISEAFLIMTLVFEHYLLQEKEHILLKIASVLCAICGAIFMVLQI